MFQLHLNIYVYIHVCVSVYIYIYIYIHIHTNTYIHGYVRASCACFLVIVVTFLYDSTKLFVIQRHDIGVKRNICYVCTNFLVDMTCSYMERKLYLQKD